MLSPRTAARRPGFPARERTTPRSPLSLLGLVMLSPALILLACFYFAPVALTTAFAFTDMSTATGIGTGAYVITPNTLSGLQNEGLPEDVAAQVMAETYVVDRAGLDAAVAAGVDEGFVADISARLSGRTYDSTHDFTRDLRDLPNAPRSPRAITAAAEIFGRSTLNRRFETREELAEALAIAAPEGAIEVREQLLDASYTGAVFTTENFRRLATQRETGRVLLNTLFYVSATLAIFNVGLALFLAITLFYLPKGLMGVFGTLWLLPRITPLVLYAILWKWFTWEGGFLPILAEQVGLPSFNYMKGSVVTAWITMISLNGFIGASFGLILFSGALRTIPMQQLWASEVDGATRWQQVRRIILPQMRWPILFVTTYQTMSLLASYAEIWLTTNGGPGRTTTVWALEAFRTALFNYSGNLEYGLGSAMALMLVIVGFTLSLVYLRLFRFDELVTRPRIEF